MEVVVVVVAADGRVRGEARAVPVPAGSRVTRAAGTRGGWVPAAGPLRIPRGRHWPAAGIVRRASPAATLRRSLCLGAPAEPGAAAGKVRAPRPPPAGSAARSLCVPLQTFFYLSFNWLLFLRMNDLSSSLKANTNSFGSEEVSAVRFWFLWRFFQFTATIF